MHNLEIVKILILEYRCLFSNLRACIFDELKLGGCEILRGIDRKFKASSVRFYTPSMLIPASVNFST